MDENHLAFSEWLSKYHKQKESLVVTAQNSFSKSIDISHAQTAFNSIIILAEKTKENQLVPSSGDPIFKTNVESASSDSIVWHQKTPAPSIDIVEKDGFDWKEAEKELWASLSWESIKIGFPTEAEDIMREIIQKTSAAMASKWIYDLFLNNTSNTLLACTLIHAFSHLEYELVYPFGPMMALAMLNQKDRMVVQFAIKAFSNWNSKHSLEYMENTLPPSEPWAAKEWEKVKSYIRKYGDEFYGVSDEKVYTLPLDTRTA